MPQTVSDFAPLPPERWPDSLDGMRSGFAGKANVYRVMARHPDLLRSWAPLRQHIVLDSALGPERLEVAILRIAHRLGSGYEWAHHVARARALGFSDARILSMRGNPEEMAGGDALIARGVDALLSAARLDPGLRDALVARIGPEGLLDLIATAGFYLTLAGIAESFGTPIDAGLPDDL